MNLYPKNLRYSSTHEWVRLEENNIVTIGITHHAQHLLGDLVFVELPKLHAQVKQSGEIAVVESVKTAADVYSPLSGVVMAINEKLQQTPGMINEDPYGEGWILRLQMDEPEQLTHLLDATGYQVLIEEHGN